MGGWVSELTQQTVLDGKLARATCSQIKKLMREFNTVLASMELEKVNIGHAVGSTSYVYNSNGWDATYGDVDWAVFLPNSTKRGKSESEILELYTKLLKEFLQNKGIETENGVNLILEVKGKYVQVDLILVFKKNRDWIEILTPAFGVKGVIHSSVFSSLSEALNLSFGVHGLRAKLRDGNIVSFRSQKDVEVVEISNSSWHWNTALIEFFVAHQGAEVDWSQRSKIDTTTENSITWWLPFIAEIADQFEVFGMYGKKGLEQYQNKEEFIQAVVDIFDAKMDKVINSVKFEKATTDHMIERANKTRAQCEWAKDEFKRVVQG